jgi:hypothetical protein
MLAIALFLFYLAIIAAVLGGWVLNVIDLASGFADMALVEVIVRIAGLPVVFLGSIMGWFF